MKDRRTINEKIVQIRKNKSEKNVINRWKKGVKRRRVGEIESVITSRLKGK